MSSTQSDYQRLLIRRLVLRLMPILWCGYVVAFLDRVNVGFAALQMNDRLGFGPATYGLGAGLFFAGYTLFEVPSNMILHRLGARIWISRIMITWGLFSCACMFMKNAGHFYLFRFLLGVGEAGFFPGVIFYLGRWIPPNARARCIAYFMSAAAVAGVLGGAVSGAILNLDGLGGLQGWQWLFLLEGLPAVGLGITVLFILPDAPANATWLDQKARNYIVSTTGEDIGGRYSIKDLVERLFSKNVICLSLIYFCFVFSVYGFGFWMPQAMQRLSDGSNVSVGLLTIVPNAFALAGMLFASRYCDLLGERTRTLQLCATISAIASFGIWFSHGSAAVVLISIAVAGIWSALSPFWSLATKSMKGIEAAAGIALVNSIGNLGGFIAPPVVGRIVELTQSIWIAFAVLGSVTLLGGVIVTIARDKI